VALLKSRVTLFRRLPIKGRAKRRALETVNAEEPKSSSEALDCWSLCRHGAPANKRQSWVRDVEVASKCREAELVYGDIDRRFSSPKTLRSVRRAKGEEVSHTLPRAREQVITTSLKHTKTT
jgi:hypothetical protein